MAKKKVKKKSAEPTTEPTFEESLAALEQIVADLDGGELDLADSLDQYEAGVAHLKRCHKLLQHAEQRVEQLSRVNADGSAETRPFADDAGDDVEQKAANRSRRRSADGVDGGNQLF